jgi:hypothetical protein
MYCAAHRAFGTVRCNAALNMSAAFKGVFMLRVLMACLPKIIEGNERRAAQESGTNAAQSSNNARDKTVLLCLTCRSFESGDCTGNQGLIGCNDRRTASPVA